MQERAKKERLYDLLREKKIRKARKSLWEFQKITSAQDYKEERTYLLILALCLQSFYQTKPIEYKSYLPPEEHQQLDLSGGNIEIEIEPYEGGSRFEVDLSEADILIIEIPPRHHKSHSLIIFEDWVFGLDPKHIMITAAHNSDLAFEFSQYVRDGIEEYRMSLTDIIYRDVFPRTRTKMGDRSKKRWSLEGTFLSYAGSGIMSPVTGKGGKLAIFDDPVKGPLEAFSEPHLEKLWTALVNGWLSRLERPRKQIHVMTPWVKGDPGDRTVEGAEESGEIVKILNMKAWEETQGMLCEDILDKRAFDILKSRMHPAVFSGNYLSKRIELIGRLYPAFKTYTPDELPTKFAEIYSYIDTADEGKDYLVAPIMGIINTRDEYEIGLKKGYMLGVYITKEGMEITEIGTAKFLVDHHVQSSMNVMIESNAGGRGFARNVERILRSEYREKGKGIHINWFHQSENKNARINAESHTVMQHIYMPANWEKLWPLYHGMMTRYMKEGNNEFDDAPDATTGLAERINQEVTMLEALKMRKRA